MPAVHEPHASRYTPVQQMTMAAEISSVVYLSLREGHATACPYTRRESPPHSHMLPLHRNQGFPDALACRFASY